MTDYEKALAFAERAHAGQVDKAGVDYIEHPKAVAAMLDDPTEKVVALLHDILEDTDISEDELRREFGPIVADAVVTITRSRKGEKPSETYAEYIDRVAENDIARHVKMADLRHNMDAKRFKGDTPEMVQQLIISRYVPSYQKLKSVEEAKRAERQTLKG